MIKFRADGPRGAVFGLGLSRADIERLTVDDAPITVKLVEMGGPPVEIVIMFGETERDLFNALKEAGCISPDCEFHDVGPDEVQIVRNEPGGK